MVAVIVPLLLEKMPFQLEISFIITKQNLQHSFHFDSVVSIKIEDWQQNFEFCCEFLNFAKWNYRHIVTKFQVPGGIYCEMWCENCEIFSALSKSVVFWVIINFAKSVWNPKKSIFWYCVACLWFIWSADDIAPFCGPSLEDSQLKTQEHINCRMA